MKAQRGGDKQQRVYWLGGDSNEQGSGIARCQLSEFSAEIADATSASPEAQPLRRRGGEISVSVRLPIHAQRCIPRKRHRVTYLVC